MMKIRLGKRLLQIGSKSDDIPYEIYPKEKTTKGGSRDEIIYCDEEYELIAAR